jgi:two-component system, NarL family, sensor kinase
MHFAAGVYQAWMHSGIPSTALPPQVETVAELRELYRAAEARARACGCCRPAAASWRWPSGKRWPILQACADRLAYFLGQRGASSRVSLGSRALPIPAPGKHRAPAGLDRRSTGCPPSMRSPTPRTAKPSPAARNDRRDDRPDRARAPCRSASSAGRSVCSPPRRKNAPRQHELHDGVAQTATALARLLEGAARRGEDISTRRRPCAAGRDRPGPGGELRGVIRGLRPTLLDDLGLAAGLHALAEALERKATV